MDISLAVDVRSQLAYVQILVSAATMLCATGSLFLHRRYPVPPLPFPFLEPTSPFLPVPRF